MISEITLIIEKKGKMNYTIRKMGGTNCARGK